MGWPIAAALVASILEAASLDADVAVRADASSRSLSVSGVPSTTRAYASATPSATAIATAGGLRLDTTYAPRFWTSDLEARSSLLVSHTLGARVATPGEGWWRAFATVAAARGRTDPLDVALQRDAAAPAARQIVTTEPLRHEELATSLGAELRLGERTTLGATGGWQGSRSRGEDAGLLPPQQGASLAVSFARTLTERDSVRVGASSGWTVTGEAGARTSSSTTTAVGTWLRRLSPSVDVWAGAGASLVYSDPQESDSSVEVQPAAELGLARGGEGRSVRVTASARATTFVDRLTGAVSPSFDGASTLTWLVHPRLSLSASGGAGGRVDGDTSVAHAALRATWAIHQSLHLEAGVSGTWQHEREATRPSFSETGVHVALAWARETLFRRAPPPPAPAAR